MYNADEQLQGPYVRSAVPARTKSDRLHLVVTSFVPEGVAVCDSSFICTLQYPAIPNS